MPYLAAVITSCRDVIHTALYAERYLKAERHAFLSTCRITETISFLFQTYYSRSSLLSLISRDNVDTESSQRNLTWKNSGARICPWKKGKLGLLVKYGLASEGFMLATLSIGQRYTCIGERDAHTARYTSKILFYAISLFKVCSETVVPNRPERS